MSVKSVYLIQNPSGKELKDFLEIPEDEIFLKEKGRIAFIFLGEKKADWKFVYDLEHKFNIHVNFFDLESVFKSIDEFNARLSDRSEIFLDKRNIVLDLKMKVERCIEKKKFM